MNLPPDFSLTHSTPPFTRIFASVETIRLWLSEQELLSGQFLTHLSRTLSALRHGRSAALDAADHHLRTHIAAGASAVSESATAGVAAVKQFETEMRARQHEFRELAARGAAIVQSITACMTAAGRIAEAVGHRGHFDWQHPPDPVLPAVEGHTAPINRSIGWGGLFSPPGTLTEHSGTLTHLWAPTVQRWAHEYEAHTDLEQQWRRAERAQQRAGETLATALRSTRVGAILVHAHHTPAGHAAAVAGGISGELWGHALPLPPPQSREQHLVSRSLGLSLAELSWHHPASPQTVAQRWLALSAEQQRVLIVQASTVIGNLAGIPPAARDAANRATLTRLSLQPSSLSPDQLATVSALNTAIRYAEHPQHRTNMSTAPIQILSADFSTPVPRVAIVRGTLDTAVNAVWLVPGMHSDAAHATSGWNELAQRLYTEQAHTGSSTAPHAVVAWLGYDTPNAREVLSSRSATEGAERLATELRAAALPRLGASSPHHTHLVAHSYGTTLATIALTHADTSVTSLTLLGSAGIDRAVVPDFSQLSVSRLPNGQPAIFAAQAESDLIAPLGAALSGRTVPTDVGGRTPLGPLTETMSPTGAIFFPVTGDPELNLAATTGHSTLGSGTSPSFLGITAPAGHGYFDSGTQSLCTVARITAGQLNTRQKPPC